MSNSEAVTDWEDVISRHPEVVEKLEEFRAEWEKPWTSPKRRTVAGFLESVDCAEGLAYADGKGGTKKHRRFNSCPSAF